MSAATHHEEPSWAELEEQFGADAVAALDRAMCATLATYQQPIRPEEHCLVTEHLTYRALLAMRDAGLRFTDGVVTLPERHMCPVCGASVTFTRTGMVRSHRREDEAGRCPTSGLPAWGNKQ